jgi:TonB family protein
LCFTLASILPVRQPAIEPLHYVLDLPAVVRIASEPLRVEPQKPDGLAIANIDTLRTVVFFAWSLGFVWCLGRLYRSWGRMHRMVRRAQTARLRVLPDVTVSLSEEIASPVLVGLWSPRILLPANITDWTTEHEQRGIILHEVAHRESGDHYSILLQRVLDAVFFFHPLVRYASRQISMERELACDAAVLRAGADSAAYADGILKVAERGVQERHGIQPAFNASRKILERRIEMILSTQHSWIPKPSWHGRVLTVALFATMAAIGVLIPRVEVMAIVAPPRFEPTPRPTVAPVLTAPTSVARRAPAARQQQQTPPPAATAPAAARPALIAGTVLDSSGAVIPGVRVSITGPQGTTPMTAVSNGLGSFTFRDLAPGRYRLEASLPDFSTYSMGLSLEPGTTLTPNIVLTLGVVEMMVAVSAARPSQITAPAVAPNASTIPPTPTRVGGDVSAPYLVAQVKPVYPAASRAAGIEGNVLISATIDKFGTVVNPKVVSKVDPDLAAAALDAVRQWRYKPALLNGQPMDIITVITVNFSLVD